LADDGRRGERHEISLSPLARGFADGANARMAGLLHFLSRTPSPHRSPLCLGSDNFDRGSVDIFDPKADGHGHLRGIVVSLNSNWA